MDAMFVILYREPNLQPDPVTGEMGYMNHKATFVAGSEISARLGFSRKMAEEKIERGGILVCLDYDEVADETDEDIQEIFEGTIALAIASGTAFYDEVTKAIYAI